MAGRNIRNLVLLLGDQLTRGISSLDGFDPARDRILMAELGEETSYVPHHVQKIVLVLAAMRHFAEELRREGLPLDYVTLEDDGNAGSFTGELEKAVNRLRPERIIVTEPGEWRLRAAMDGWAARFDLPVEIRTDTRFFASLERFAAWAKERRSFRMEHFYREMRRETGILMEGDEPAGGRWNFDAENRKALPKEERVPRRHGVEPDAITRAVIDMVRRRFPDNFGELDGFGWAVTRDDALEALDRFVAELLPRFGDYQDAMKRGAPFLFHAVLSPYLNIGLLTAGEVCTAAETAWRDGSAPLNAVEGFIRQILGWREYVRGVYWLRMPDYPKSNAFGADRPLPDFYWTGETDMACMADCIAATRRHAYAHHIQRLMVTGNFALLAGLRPAEVEAWYLVVYADAFEWVELPNVHGMALFADGGLLASKPYAASGAYIDRMSDYCTGCAYDPKAKTGAKACPFNLLYWRFLSVNRDRLAGNPRMAMPYRTLDRMDPRLRAAVLAAADAWLGRLDATDRTYAAPRPVEQGNLFD